MKLKFSAKKIRHCDMDVLRALRDTAVELGMDFVDQSVENANEYGGDPLKCFALSSPIEDFERELKDDAPLWDGAIEAFLRDYLADGEPKDGLSDIVGDELAKFFPLIFDTAQTRRDEQLEQYTPPHAKKTYRELLAVAEILDTEDNLFELGQWLGNEGSRAQRFPDAVPVNMPGWEFPVDFLEDREEALKADFLEPR